MNLIEKLTNEQNIHLAYERVKNDLMNRELKNHHEQEAFAACVPRIYHQLGQILRRPGEYQFRELEILQKPKKFAQERGSWESRPLARMRLVDAVLAQAVVNVVAELIGHLLPTRNFGYRLADSSAVYMYERWQTGYAKFVENEVMAVQEGQPYQYVYEADLRHFYPSIDQQKLIQELAGVILHPQYQQGEVLLDWLRQIISLYDGTGLPQGPVYAPVLALFYIRNCFRSRRMQAVLSGVYYFAYVDDFRFYTQSREQALKIAQVFPQVMQELQLECNPEKTGVFPIDREKRQEVLVLGKASNLKRAIRDQVLLTQESREKMKQSLGQLVQEAEGLFKSEKTLERIRRLGQYRISMLMDQPEDWEAGLDRLRTDPEVQANYVAMLHLLHLHATSNQQKKQLMATLRQVIAMEGIGALSYVRYIAFQYHFKWSPVELRISSGEQQKMLDQLLPYIEENHLYLKAICSGGHRDWFGWLGAGLVARRMSFDPGDYELWLGLRSLGLRVEVPFYDQQRIHLQLEQTGDQLQFISLSAVGTDRYLLHESCRGISYQRLIPTGEGMWGRELPLGYQSLREMLPKLSLEARRELLLQIGKWLQIQFVDGVAIPCSVVDPDYIWIGEGSIMLYGNPAYQHEQYYPQVPIRLWREALGQLIGKLFQIDLTQIKHSGEAPALHFWQFRIVQLLLGTDFGPGEFVSWLVQILSQQDRSGEMLVEAGHYQMAHLARHYIHSTKLHDQFLEMARFVEGSWRNGSKDCYYYTLHDHEHGRELIRVIQRLREQAGYQLYLHEKEALRLFVACFWHDLGMLSRPEAAELVAVTREVGLGEVGGSDLPDQLAYDDGMELLRETYVRERHGLISEQELVREYPELPLTVAERRDIGVISRVHTQNQAEVAQLSDDLYDGEDQIRLGLLARLLRLADLCDVTHQRVNQEVLERNAERMSPVSVFHWIKHLSIGKLRLETLTTGVLAEQVTVGIMIVHNFVPRLEVPMEITCRSKWGLTRCEEFANQAGNNYLQEVAQKYNYYLLKESNKCNLTCLFLRITYDWFYEEVLALNEYFTEQKIGIQLELLLVGSEAMYPDFNYVQKRYHQKSAAEFMRAYLMKE